MGAGESVRASNSVSCSCTVRVTLPGEERPGGTVRYTVPVRPRALRRSRVPSYWRRRAWRTARAMPTMPAKPMGMARKTARKPGRPTWWSHRPPQPKSTRKATTPRTVNRCRPVSGVSGSAAASWSGPPSASGPSKSGPSASGTPASPSLSNAPPQRGERSESAGSAWRVRRCRAERGPGQRGIATRLP